MKLLLLVASLLIIATPHAHARILQAGIVNSASDKLDTIIISVYGRQQPSPPPSPFPSPTKHHSTRGNTGPCDNDTTNTYNSNKIKCPRARYHTISSPPPAMAAERNKPSPPPPPKGPGRIIPLRMRTPSALCMPGRPCAAGGCVM